jgi:excisionase family DNA binding protein
MLTKIRIPFAPVRTALREAVGARGHILIVITLAGGLTMLVASGCTRNMSSPLTPLRPSPQAKRAGVAAGRDPRRPKTCVGVASRIWRSNGLTAGSDVATPDELALALHVPRKTIVALCRTGKLPGARKVGRGWRIPEAAVASFFDADLPGVAGHMDP